MTADARTVEAELASSTAAAKCHKCGCFQDAVTALEASALKGPLADALAQARARVEPRAYDCLGCSVCWPANALNAAAHIVDLPTSAGCPTEDPPRRPGWPQVPGEYCALRFTAPVAVVTLHSRSLMDELARARPAGLSIVGPVQTENLGIERIIENVVGNPNIRILLVCGEDTAGQVGHFPGQSLLALVRNGLDEHGRIREAQGRRPMIRNVPREVVERFRGQVEALDGRGERRAAVIGEIVRKAAAAAPGPVPGATGIPRAMGIMPARPPARLVLDPRGYVVIVPDRQRHVLVAEHYDTAGILQAIVEGTAPTHLIGTLIDIGAVSRMDHAAYLARELTLAERALDQGTDYVQDRAPGPPPATCSCGPDCGGTP